MFDFENFFKDTPQNTSGHLKVDAMGKWIETEWYPRYPEQKLITLWSSYACTSQQVLKKFSRNKALFGGFKFVGYEEIACPVTTPVKFHSEDGKITYQAGAFLFEFSNAKTGETLKVLLTAAPPYDEADCWKLVCLACVPENFIKTWAAFAKECSRLAHALEPASKVVIVGGRANAFVPTTDWENIVLPTELKNDLMSDVESFFTKGIDIYNRLKLKPFRKLLLAGVPGTGKTMLCSALAKWALARKYLVIYISSSDRHGAEFWKIEHALDVAADSKLPTIILLEEIDAYLHEAKEKAMVLNILDGAESSPNKRGSLLIATTNKPESIDERILKRPGRLDRIFIIPEAQDIANAEKLLRQYLGDMWQADHSVIAGELVGYPGAFIREVAIHALTQVAYEDMNELPFELLERSFTRLREQIDVRDEFLHKRANIGLLAR